MMSIESNNPNGAIQWIFLMDTHQYKEYLNVHYSIGKVIVYQIPYRRARAWPSG